jgi:hypothetical protein
MDVLEVIDLSGGHSIEFGKSTWDKDSQSIRNRYLTPSGGFSPHSSSEMPIADVFTLALETVRRDYLEPIQTMELLQAVLDSVKRQFIAR